MAATAFVSGTDLDELFELIDGGFLDDDESITEELESFISELPSVEQSSEVFSCHMCDKVCKSARGLTRHKNTKHQELSTSSSSNVTLKSEEAALKKLHPLHLKVIVQKCAKNLSTDLCFPEDMRAKFLNICFTADNSTTLWDKIKSSLISFKGDPEKFYSVFFGLMCTNLMPDHFEDMTITNTLLREVSTEVLLHMSGGNKVDITPTNKPIGEKELQSLQYLAGFVIHKLYTRYRKAAAKKKNVSHFQYCSILKACKVECDENQTLVNVRDRGGLWRANKKIIDLLVQCEVLFRSKTSVFCTSLSAKDFVSEIITSNIIVRSNFNDVCMSADTPVPKEIQKNILEQIITLFVRVRTFSFAKNTRERYKTAKKETRKRSLRTEIKKSTAQALEEI